MSSLPVVNILGWSFARGFVVNTGALTPVDIVAAGDPSLMAAYAGYRQVGSVDLFNRSVVLIYPGGLSTPNIPNTQGITAGKGYNYNTSKSTGLVLPTTINVQTPQEAGSEFEE